MSKTVKTKPTKETVYTLIWCNRWPTANAETIDDMIDRLQGAANELRAMRAKGVVMSYDCCVPEDHAELITTDPKVAKEFGFEEEEWSDEDHECDEFLSAEDSHEEEEEECDDAEMHELGAVVETLLTMIGRKQGKKSRGMRTR